MPKYSETGIKEIADSYLIQTYEDKVRTSGGFSTKIYMDTYDVVKLIQGLLVFDDGLKFDVDAFEYDRSILVHAFAYKGYLGEIHLLPSHQDELSQQIRENRAKFPNHNAFQFKELQQEFFQHTKLDEIMEGLSDIDPKNMKNYVDILKGEAVDVFKGNYLIEELSWVKRFKKLHNSKRLILKPKSYSVSELVKEDLFIKIKKAIDKARPRRSFQLSNFTDALALYHLQLELEEFKNNPDNRVLPVLYASSRGIQKAVQILMADEKLHLFSYKSKGGKKIPIVRETIYFVMDIIFNTKNQDDKIDNVFDELQDLSSDKISGLKSGIDQIYQIYKNNVLKAKIMGKRYDHYYDEFKKSVNDLIDAEFIKEIWLEKSAYEDLEGTIKNYDKFQKDFNKYVPEYINREIESILKDLNINSDRLKLFSEIFRGFIKIDEKINRNFLPINDELDVYRDYGLLRFSFDHLECPAIQENIEGLFKSVDEGNNEHNIYVSQIASFLISGLYESNEQHLLTGLGVLWVLDKHSLIDKICERLNSNYSRYQIALLHAASLSMLGGKNRKKIDEILECLSGKESYHIWIGMAYIHFRLWDFESGYPRIPELLEKNNKKAFFNRSKSSHYKKAIGYILKAIERLEEIKDGDAAKTSHRLSKYLYAINNYIYYITKGGTVEDFKKIEPWYEKLSAFAQNLNLWQGRFYDTLGWYNLRKAKLTNNIALYEYHLGEAEKFNLRANEWIKTPRDATIYEDLSSLIAKWKVDPPI